MIELNPVEFHKAFPIFAKIDHSVAIVHAILEGNSPGRIFMDVPHSPTVALLHAEDAFFYINGDENNASLAEELVPLLFDHILPQMEEKEIVIFSFSDSWMHKLDELLKEKHAIQIRRKMFKFDPEKFMPYQNWKINLPTGFFMREINDQFSPASKRFGVRLMQGNEIISECSSIFVGGGEAEIDIHTNENYRGRGFATLTASAFIEACLAGNLTPNWACWPERKASYALAKKLGFVELPDIPAHLWAEDM